MNNKTAKLLRHISRDRWQYRKTKKLYIKLNWKKKTLFREKMIQLLNPKKSDL